MTKKYIDADKLKAEIEKRAKFHDDAIKACVGLNDIAITHSAGWKEDTELLTIINSLQQEQPEVDLEKAAEEYADKHGFRVPYDGSDKYYDDVDVKASLEGFKAGAKWMAEQIKGGSK